MKKNFLSNFLHRFRDTVVFAYFRYFVVLSVQNIIFDYDASFVSAFVSRSRVCCGQSFIEKNFSI